MQVEMPVRQYRHPPIREAICELKFADQADFDWDITLPGRLQQQIGDLYPGKPRHQLAMEAELQAGNPAPAAFMLRQGVVRIQFPDARNHHLIAVGPGSLAMHVTRPYPGWSIFRERIVRGIDSYFAACGQVPKGVSRIGPRYLNRITLPSGAIELNDYFTVPPLLPSNMAATMTSAATRVEAFFQADPTVRLILGWGSAPPEADLFAESQKIETAFLLDLDVVWLQTEEPLGPDLVMNRVDELRELERDAFEALVTDRLRETFDAE